MLQRALAYIMLAGADAAIIEPSPAPSSSAAPSPRPPEPTPLPSAGPSATAAPTAPPTACADEPAWRKAGAPRRTAPGSRHAFTRCYVVGDDDRKATEGCQVSCGTCTAPPTRAPTAYIAAESYSYSYGDRDFVVVDDGGEDDRDARDDDGGEDDRDARDDGGGEDDRDARRLPIALAGADAAITWEEAKCVLRGQKVTFFGDSLTRYCFFGLNNFLATGELRADEFSSKQSMGAGPGSGDYDGIESWNAEGILTDQATQRQHAWKTFSDGDFDTRPIETEFYFIQHVWWDDADDTPQEADTPIGSKGHTLADQVAGDATLADVAATLEADVVVYNMGWWQLLKSYSAYEYDATLARVVDELLDVDGRLGIYRTASCCGKEIDGDIGAWVAPIEAQNRVAAALMARRGVPVVDVYPLYGLDALDAHTFDDKHANVATCHAWNELILREIDARRNTSCVSGVFTAPGTTRRPRLRRAPRRPPRQRALGRAVGVLRAAPPTPGRVAAAVAAAAVAAAAVAAAVVRRRRPRSVAAAVAAPSSRYAPSAPPSSSAAPSPRPPEPTPPPSAGPSARYEPSPAPTPRPPPSAACVDDGAWHKKGQPWKDCAWASALPATRCLAVGAADGAAAWAACRRSCGCSGPPTAAPAAAPTAPPAACADEPAWRKKGAPSKDCAWVAAYAFTRCYVVGDDDRKATAGCRVACGTCSPPPTRAPVVAIPQGCASYFDGCNTCDGSGRSCTEMFCETATAARDDDGSVAKTDDDSGGGEAIPAGCTSWYDGCNTCAVTSDAGALACTKKFCDDYGDARCLAYGAAGDDDGRGALVVDGRDAAYDDDGHDDGGDAAASAAAAAADDDDGGGADAASIGLAAGLAVAGVAVARL
ncbi:N2-acetyl-L-ornithine:2-oxoglutarate 5-aminotransferase [Aureococcus anophagefferens]|nr:N2-acetyl-L-ornithine:2-oxoglutarate 5-aminotransferase [Aureococcus anophagefferens]